MLSPEEERHLLLESYKEQTVSWKHHDQLFQRFTSIILPVSFTALVVPYVKEGVSKLPIAGGIVLMLSWIVYSEIADIKARICFEIIHEIEKKLGMYGHRNWDKKRKERWTRWLGTRRLHLVIFVIYFVASIVFLWDPYNWFPLPKS